MVDTWRVYGVTRNNYFDNNINNTKLDMEKKKIYIEKIWNTSLMKSISKYYNITTDTKVVAPTPPQKGYSSKSGQCASECHWAAYNGDINKLESYIKNINGK